VSDDAGTKPNDSTRFDRLPATAGDRTVEGRATRREVLEWWEGRFGIPPAAFEDFTFWEKGAGKVWILAGDAADPIEIEALGMTFLRTRQEHWKPTTEAVQRFGELATENVVDLDDEAARRFLAGEDQEIEWGGDWGYLVAAHDVAGERAPIGVGLFTYGELKSMVPKGRRREF
jgi:NOL1/NOP2/fmu family ribosome biogenesis protein